MIYFSETHLINDQVLDVDGFTWFGNNRKGLHKRAKKGSGGVGFLVKNEILNVYNVTVQDDMTDGILWLKFESRNSKETFFSCVCYLPPADSTRSIDANEFFDQLICQIHQYCKSSMFSICGDFNARCADFQDFIAGVDIIPERQVIDFTAKTW